MQPIVDAGLHELVEHDHRLCEEVRLVPSFGHTPGHVSLRISSEGQEAFITGDMAHHPCQFARPHWSTTADSDPAAAEATRRRVLGELAGTEVLVIGTHFAGISSGRIARDGEAWRMLTCW